MAHLLNQTEVWRNNKGDLVPLETMSGRYALNAYNLLKRNHLAIGFRYGLWLYGVGLPDEDTVAYDVVTADVEREQDRIQADSLAWLLDKPLMRALADRMVADSSNLLKSDVKPEVDQPEVAVDGVRLPYFEVKPPARPIGDFDYAPTANDPVKVFLVTRGSYSDYAVEAVYVGNRGAANDHAAEYNRYHSNEAQVEDFTDGCVGGTQTYGQVRRYPPLYTEVRFQTNVDLFTGEASVLPAQTEVRRAPEPHRVVTSTSTSDQRKRPQLVCVVTEGPDTEIDQIRKSHAEHVARVRVAVVQSEPLFNADTEEIDL